MSAVGHVALGWAFSGVVLAAYAWRVLRRGRRLSAVVPEDRRRWT